MNERLLLNYSMGRNLIHHISECLDAVLICLSSLNNSQTNCLLSQKRWHSLDMNLTQKVGIFDLRLSIKLWLLLILSLMRTSFHTVPNIKKIDLPLFLYDSTISKSNELPFLNNDFQPQALKPNWDVYIPISIPCSNTPDLNDANPALDQEPWFPPMSPQRPQSPLGFNSPAHPPSYRTDFSPLHPGIWCDWPETGHRSDIEDQHQHKRYMLINSPPASPSLEEEDWLVKPIPQSWFPPRQQSGESLPEFQSHSHQHHPTHDDRSSFRPLVVQQRSTCIPQPWFLPDNAYGNHPPAQIKREINLELDPIQEESSPQEESSMDIIPAKIVQRPTNELEDLEEMYSSKWMQHHFALAVDQGEWCYTCGTSPNLKVYTLE